MDMNMAMLFPILFPMVCGAAVMWLPPLRASRARHIFISASLLLNLAVVLTLLAQPDLRWEAFRFTAKLTLLLKMDNLSRLFAALTSLVWLAAGVYAFEYMKHEEHEERFFLFYLLTLGALIGLSFAGNYMTLYLFFEMITLASVPMVLHSMTRKAIREALKYLFYSIAGASLSLVGFTLMLTYGSIEFLPGGTLDAHKIVGHETVLLIGAMLSIIGFGTKAGMFPMHAWLPAAHPVAPAPASAVLSGVITKAGVLAVFRVVFYQFGAGFIRGSWVQYVWIVLCLITIFMGSMLAFKEQQLKKRLAYSSVSQVSYILFGFAVLTEGGALGALLHLVFHGVIKNGLFLSAGAVIYMTHKIKVADLRAAGKEMPVVFWCFTLLSLALIGIPPTSGFVSKWHLALGSLSAGVGVLAWVGPVVLLASALLTACYLLGIAIPGLFPGVEAEGKTYEDKEPAAAMLAPLLCLTAPAVALGVFPNALISLISVITGGLF